MCSDKKILLIGYLCYFYRMTTFYDVTVSYDAQRSSLGLWPCFMCLPNLCIPIEEKALNTTFRVSYRWMLEKYSFFFKVKPVPHHAWYHCSWGGDTEAGTYDVGQGGMVVSAAVTFLSSKTQSKTWMCMVAFQILTLFPAHLHLPSLPMRIYFLWLCQACCIITSVVSCYRLLSKVTPAAFIK